MLAALAEYYLGSIRQANTRRAEIGRASIGRGQRPEAQQADQCRMDHHQVNCRCFEYYRFRYHQPLSLQVEGFLELLRSRCR